MARECIVLAGGLGTRLRDVVPDLPKCLAMANGKPFLHYVFRYLEKHQVQQVILALGYKHELITDWCSRHKQLPFSLSYSVEEEPLGTGGAVKKALEHASEKEVLILNGDTLFNVEVRALEDFHRQHSAALTLALKPMENFDRYGVVKLDEDGRIISFEEKKHYRSGLINGGLYLVNKPAFSSLPLPEKFSFEKDYLERYAPAERFFGYKTDDYFIDIGIPEDYRRVQTEIRQIFEHDH